MVLAAVVDCHLPAGKDEHSDVDRARNVASLSRVFVRLVYRRLCVIHLTNNKYRGLVIEKSNMVRCLRAEPAT